MLSLGEKYLEMEQAKNVSKFYRTTCGDRRVVDERRHYSRGS